MEDGVGFFVTCLGHDFIEGGVVFSGGGGEACTEGVTAELGGWEFDVFSMFFYDEADGVGGESVF